MSDHADSGEYGLHTNWENCEGGLCCDEALAIMEALVAERDEAQERGNTWHGHFENVNSQLKRKQVECDDLTVRVLAAEAERDRAQNELIDSMIQIAAAEAERDEAREELIRLSKAEQHYVESRLRAEAELVEWKATVNVLMGERTATEAEVARLAQGVTAQAEEARMLREAAMALYERVQMDESVGICLSERVTTLALGAALAKEDDDD